MTDENKDMRSDLDKKIGDIETQTLAPAQVDIIRVEFKEVKKKDSGVKVGEKLILFVQHPDKKDQLIEISECKVIDGDKVVLATLWKNLDDAGNIRKGSHLAKVMQFFGCKIVKDFEGKKGVQTVQKAENNKYLCIKAYN